MRRWRRAALVAAAWMMVAGAAGCTSARSLRAVAQQNQTNVASYNANVAQLVATVRRQARVQADLQVQVAREAFSRQLVALRIAWLGASSPTRAELADPTRPPHSVVAAQVEEAGRLPHHAAEDRRLIEEKYPLVADIVLGTRRADTTEVVTDAFELADLNHRISAEPNGAIRAILMAKRNALLDRYPPVRRERETVQDYLDALDQALADVQRQGELAALHAQTFLTVSEAAPAVETLAGAFRDEELRGRVLDVVKRRKGDAAAARVSRLLAAGDEAVGVIEGLTRP